MSKINAENKVISIKKACAITDDTFTKLVKHFSLFKTEKDVERFILDEIKVRKLRQAFSPIVASGKNAADPHHKPTNELLHSGFCVIDFGVRINGYCSDMTRTVFIGNPTVAEKNLYAKLLLIQNDVSAMVKVGVNYSSLDMYVRKKLGAYAKYFIHTLGHGVGKWIHCKPRIGSMFRKPNKKLTKAKQEKRELKIKQILSATANFGDVITIEPGIYVKGKYGIRIEDTIVVSNNGPVVLTTFSKKLICI